MDIEIFRRLCLEKKGVTEGFPFGGDALVFKVLHKMFALVGLDEVPPTVNLKCDPERSVELRERYLAVTPGYHMDKRHWNSVRFDGTIPDAEIIEMLDHSYDLVVRSLRKADRTALDET